MIARFHVSHGAAWLLSLITALALASSARAQSTEVSDFPSPRAQLDEPVPEEDRPDDRPWAIGVSQEHQTHARALYQAGNRFLADSFFAAAATKYRAALQHWNHPGIHYNLALTLVSLDRPIEAYLSIVEALRYGPDALQPEEYRRAIDYKRMLWRQIAEVKVVCNEPGAVVTLDGKPLFTGAGQLAVLVLPGEHQIIATKTKYITASQTVTLAAASCECRTQYRLQSRGADSLCRRGAPPCAAAPATAPSAHCHP